ncbi:MAG: HdeD family acid-resistance protein [Terriglobales bacterium]|jgi:uncharacterized membrane protein HdeD (DUF308 family)
MIRDLVANWWLLRARGILALAFGAFLVFLAGTMEGVFSTAIALVAVLMIFVAYLVVSGLLSIIAAAKAYGKPHRFYHLAVHGSLLLLLGIGLFFLKEITVLWLVWFMVVTAMTSGVLEIALGHSLRRHLDSKLLQAAGAISVISAALLLLGRNLGPSVLVEGLGVYVIYYGGVLVLLSIRLREIARVELRKTCATPKSELYRPKEDALIGRK